MEILFSFVNLNRIINFEGVWSALPRWCGNLSAIYPQQLLPKWLPSPTCQNQHCVFNCQYGVPFVKILYLTDLAQKLLSLNMF